MRKRKHANLHVILTSVATIAVVGLVINATQNRSAVPHAAAQMSQQERLVHQNFQQAVTMLNERQFEHAIQGFHAVLSLRPEMPEAHVNMGFALLGLKQYDAAIDFFNSATDLRPSQHNAYYGLAVANEELGNLRDAIVAMQAYVHVAQSDDPYVRKAEAAIWEWKAAVAEQDQWQK